MTVLRCSTLVRLGLVLVLFVFVGSACSLSGGGDDKESDAQPTVPATVTSPPTRTAFPTFTPFPTLTPGSGFAQIVPTATAIAFLPTSTPFPTWTPQQATATTLPYDVRISYPVSGSQIAGYITIVGSASHPRFLQYALEWGPDPNPGNLWFALTGARTQPVINGGLGSWNTTTLTDSTYQLRVHVWLNDGTETFALVTGLRVSNQDPTAVPTLTPTPKPNHAPQINPIPSQVVAAGSSINIPVTTSDADGDTVNLFVSSTNNAIAAGQVTGTSQITLTGVTAGAATITVTANDNNGGLTSTAFIVTVEGQNQAPKISPILAQMVEVGQTVDVSLAASDPDGDTLTATAESDDAAILTATTVGTSAVRLTGVSVGTANVTVSVSDPSGSTIKTTFQVTVGQPNQAPTISMIPAQTLSAGDSLAVTYTAVDPDGDALDHLASSDTTNVVTATVVTPGTIQLVAINPGPATVTLTVDDNVNAPTIITFPVTVVAGNVAPSLDPIAPQTMSVGEARDVAYSVIDPESDPLTESVSSDNPGVVTAAINTSGLVTLNGVSAGTATVTLTVNDGNNANVSQSFTVSVAAINQPPAIETIFPQVLNVGEALDVPYATNDPEGDTLTANVSSDNPGVVTAAINTPGTITLNGAVAGAATVTLTVNDGNNNPVSMPFSVTVNATNKPPTVNALSPQVMNVGDMLDVPYVASDPDGDTLTGTASSDNPGVVVAAVNTQGAVSLQAVGAGTANVTLSVTDNVNTPATIVFAVTVNAPNNPPSLDPVGAQVLNMGDMLDVPYVASDPDGDALIGTASSDNPGVVVAAVNTQGAVSLQAVGGGTASVTLNVTDNVNVPATIVFAVTVNAPNNPPSLDPVGAQVLNVGDMLDVPYVASDPDGDALTGTASSDNPGVVVAAVNTQGAVSLQAVGGGTANVTLSVTDNVNVPATVVFQVTVNAPNNPPSLDPVGAQVLNVGDMLDVPYVASDPDGDALTGTASSDNPGVVVAAVNTQGAVSLQVVGAGTANVTLSVTDNVNIPATVVFQVTVNAPNNPPSLDPVGAQVLNVGDVLDVPYVASDPNGDALTGTASSDNPGVVVAAVNMQGAVSLQAVGGGTANVTLSVTDNVNVPATVVFAVTVNALNNAPQLQPVGDQTLNVGEQINVTVSVFDPDGDPVALVASSQNPGVVGAQAFGTDTVQLTGVAEGVVAVDVVADDAKGGVATVTFNVTVSSAPGGFDLNAYPVVPDISQQMVQSLNQLYQSGMSNFGNRPGVFVRIGDETADGPNFMAPFAGDYNLGDYGSLQSVIDFFGSTSVRPDDGSITSFNADSIAAEADLGIDGLASTVPGGTVCDSVGGGTLLSCEMQLSRGSIALITFSASNVTYLPPEQFRAELQALVTDLLSNYGVIPVLATIPSSDAQVLAYNQVIVEVASQSGINGIPLWNLWKAMNDRGITDPNSVAPEGPGNLTNGALNYGYNVRNLTALQTLDKVRQAVGIN